jgi:hypothetical protein
MVCRVGGIFVPECCVIGLGGWIVKVPKLAPLLASNKKLEMIFLFNCIN